MAGGSRLRLVRGGGETRNGAFERYYRECYPMVYNHVFRRLADYSATEDVVSEAFLRAARFFDRFDPARAKFSTWVISIARNCISDYYSRNVPTAAIEDVSEAAFATTDSYDDQSGERDLARRLLELLDDAERELVHMKYYEGKRNIEIAKELGINASTVSTKLARAMAKMRAAAPDEAS